MIAADWKIEIGAPSSSGTWSTGTDIRWLEFILQESGVEWSPRLICRDDIVIEAAFLDQDGRLLPLESAVVQVEHRTFWLLGAMAAAAVRHRA